MSLIIKTDLIVDKEAKDALKVLKEKGILDWYRASNYLTFEVLHVVRYVEDK